MPVDSLKCLILLATAGELLEWNSRHQSMGHKAIPLASEEAIARAPIIFQLFDPFFTTKPVGKGTGMGLSISYQIIVEKHGGQLSCLSAPEQGGLFAIKIPIQQLLSRNFREL